MTGTSDNRSLLNDGLIVAAVSVASYALAFSYEAGFATFFHIPDALIEVDVTVVFSVFSALCMFALGIYVFLDWVGVRSIWGRLSRPLIRFVVLNFSMYLIAGFYVVVLMGFGIGEPVLLLALLSCFVFVTGPYLIISFRTRQTHGGYLKALENLLAQKDNNYLTARLVSIFGARIVNAAVGLMVIDMMVYGFGYYRARSQNEYYVIQSSPPQVVLRFYPDAVITTNFDGRTRMIGQTIDILRKNAVDRLDLRYEKIGPLRPPKRHPAGDVTKSIRAPRGE